MIRNLFKTIALSVALSITTFSAMAQGYVVSGSFDSNENGIYLPTGSTCNGSPSYTLSSGGTLYSLENVFGQWSIGQDFGSCNNSQDYMNFSSSITVPTGSSGWGGVTVMPNQRTISYNPGYLAESGC